MKEVAAANARAVCLLGNEEFFFDGDGGNKCTQRLKNGRGLKNYRLIIVFRRNVIPTEIPVNKVIFL
ncbi:hypothetical protein F7731_17570 [Cytobacillus depressus]|uniref:Uncharacterized protein n=1 Tax=Cytobacillus depressus TaxID=1602942 RepID=A0A6L3V3U2_9BACI|nr:hypothetical protein F7731_17570 [Cytobacillus depressus]